MLVSTGAGPVAAPPMAGLNKLETGEWELRERGDSREPRRMCVSDPRQLLQVRHARHSCRDFLVTDEPNMVVVTYDCAGAGGGRTDLRIETSRLVQIQSQGIADGAPFAFAMEGRRTGICH